MDFSQQNREIEVITPLGRDVLLLKEFQVYEELGRLFRIELELISTSQIRFEDLLGQNISIRLNLSDGDKPRFFNGFIGSFSQRVTEGQFARYRAIAYPWLWFLTHTSDCRIFQDKTVPQIIKEVLNELGFTDYVDRLCGDYRVWEYCVQYCESDFHFLSRLMEEEGIYYYFLHEQEKHILYLADDWGSHEKITNYETISYFPQDEVVNREIEYIFDWKLTKEIQTGMYSLNEYDFRKPKADLHVNQSVDYEKSHAHYERYYFPGKYSDRTEGVNYAKVRIQELQKQYERMEGTSNVRGLICGGLFKLDLFPRQDQNREYLITAVTHDIRIDSYYADSGKDARQYSNSFSVITSTTPFRASRTTPKPYLQGPQTAIVVGPKGEEIYTDKYGRVKVQFHWDRRGEANENSSCWLRVAHPWAGNNWGMIAIPRIGQEVIVNFLEGDPDRPIITGSVYNADQMPPYELPKEMTKSTMKSNSSKGGNGFNELRFEDKKGSEQVFLHAERNQDNRVKNDSREWIGKDRHLIVAGDQLERVGGDKHLTIQGDQNEKVNGTLSQNVAMDLQQKVGMKYALDTGTEIHLKAGLNLVIEAGTSLTLKVGGNFINLNPGGVFIQGAMVMVNSGGSAGSGSGSTPVTPEAPAEADKAKPGGIAPPPISKVQDKPKSFSPQVAVLKEAARTGTPFCEKCEVTKDAT